ncbi:hypothetical protein BDY24DRAFT_413086 [Mrakia frigida]|uniref:uncharacterized protein n=1 Tax=Mrakia frigida TaxID=29902 RepID=UPI003FCBF282
MPKDKTIKSSKKDKSSKKTKEVVEEVFPAVVQEESAPVASSSSSSSPPPPPSASAPEPITEPTTIEDDDDPSLLTIDTTLPAPLSKAALRKSKAKGLPPPLPVPSSSVPVVKLDEDGNEIKAPPKIKEPKVEKFSIWIGNLAFKTTEQQVRDFLSSALKKPRKWGKGSAEKKEGSEAGSDSEEDEEEPEEDEDTETTDAMITRINLPKTGSGGKWGANKGFAYVDFSTAEACHRAVKLSEGHLDGRALLIKLGSDFSSRPITPATVALPENKTKSRTVQALLAKQKNAAGTSLFVGNLGFEATEESLRTLIEEHWQTSLSSSKHSSKQKKSVFRPEPVEGGDEKKPAAVVAEGEDAEEGQEGEKKEKVEVVGKDGKVEEVEVSGAGLRKIRMGQFQDTGRCKGFAFLDFYNSAQATAALIDMRNHKLDGRALTLEYASPSSAARSGSGTQTFNTPIVEEDPNADPNAPPVKVRPPPTPKSSLKPPRLQKKERAAAREAAGLPPSVPVDAPNNPMPPPRNFGGERLKAKRGREGEDEGGERAGGERAERSERREGGGEREEKRRGGKMAKWEIAGRARPGAALAMAKRAPTGITTPTSHRIYPGASSERADLLKEPGQQTTSPPSLRGSATCSSCFSFPTVTMENTQGPPPLRPATEDLPRKINSEIVPPQNLFLRLLPLNIHHQPNLLPTQQIATTTMSDIDEKDLHEGQHIEKLDKTQHLDTNAKNVEVLHVFNARYAAAVRTDAVNGKSRESLILYLSCAVSFLCACANGYDGSLMTSIIAMKWFQEQFASGTTGSTVSVIFSMYTVGSMVGAFSAGPLSDRFGRRVGMFCGGSVIIFGSIVISTAKKIPQLVVGRFILGWGISIMTLNLVGEGISAIAAVTAACLTDRMPRRPVLISGTLGSALCLLIHAVLSLKWAQQDTTPDPSRPGEVIYVNPNLALGQTAVTFFFLFKVVFSFSYTPLQGAYPAECLESTARAKGMGISGFIVSGIGFINQFAGPIALQNIKNSYAFVFVGWDCVEALCWYLFGVETQGRTLEQLQDIFDAPNPVKASKHRDTVAIKRDGDHIAVVEQI